MPCTMMRRSLIVMALSRGRWSAWFTAKGSPPIRSRAVLSQVIGIASLAGCRDSAVDAQMTEEQKELPDAGVSRLRRRAVGGGDRWRAERRTTMPQAGCPDGGRGRPQP